MKSMLTVLALLVSSSAMAAADPLLSYSRVASGVAPRFRTTRVCSVYATQVTKVLKGTSMRPAPIKTQVAFTADVKNADAVSKLIVKAEKERTHCQKSPPSGGRPVETWTAFRAKGENLAEQAFELQSQGGPKGCTRSGGASAKLVEFIRFNCEQQ